MCSQPVTLSRSGGKVGPALDIHRRTCVRIRGMDKRKHYWNGRWGRLARHDLMIYEDAGLWRVEHRTGGVEGRSRWDEFEDEDAALANFAT